MFLTVKAESDGIPQSELGDDDEEVRVEVKISIKL